MVAPTVVNGCDAAIWLDNASGTPKDISGTSNNFTINLTKKVGESATFGSKGPRRLGCGSDATLDLTILYSTDSDQAMDILKAWMLSSLSSRTVTMFVPTKNVGSDKYSGEWMLESLNIPVQAGEGKPIEVKARLLIDGDITIVENAT